MADVRAFLQRKNIVFSLQRYGIDALGGMAAGLFASLILGLILKTMGQGLGLTFLQTFGAKAMACAGACIGIGVAHGLKAPALVLFASAVTGMAGMADGGPAGAFVAAVIGVECGKLVNGETKLDIFITPAATLLTGLAVATAVGPAVGSAMKGLGSLIMWATTMQPIPMGVIVSVVMGMVLTLPISSAALAIMLALGGIAAGAATVGCSCQMVGFAVMGWRVNGLSGLVSVGVGTSMLQMPNIVRNPRIWIPPTLASAVLGPLVTTLFPMTNIPEGAGMGTSGLVGQVGTFASMGSGVEVWLLVLAFHIVLPAVLTLLFANVCKRLGRFTDGDLSLER